MFKVFWATANPHEEKVEPAKTLKIRIEAQSYF